MSEAKNRIVVILFQYSVVVKGIERKLKDLGYYVEVHTGNFGMIREAYESADLFILYLPNDVMDEEGKQKSVGEICQEVGFLEKKMMIIGEERYHDELQDACPDIERYVWLSRPVDMAKLGDDIEKAMETETKPETKKNILIVDDDPAYAGMVREWIKDIYHVSIVTAGMQAISFLLKHPVDLILLDYEMPVVDGPQVLQMLRQDPETRNIPVVFLTGVGTKEGVQRVMALKPAGYILKSTTRINLQNSIADKFRK